MVYVQLNEAVRGFHDDMHRHYKGFAARKGAYPRYGSLGGPEGVPVYIPPLSQLHNFLKFYFQTKKGL